MPENPSFDPAANHLTVPEIRQTLKMFVNDIGVRKIRLTGGEPTLRSDFGKVLEVIGEIREDFEEKMEREREREMVMEKEMSTHSRKEMSSREMLNQAAIGIEAVGGGRNARGKGVSATVNNEYDANNATRGGTNLGGKIHLPPKPKLQKLQKLSLGMTTNGLLLSRYFDQLKEAGVTNLNFSCDTLVPAKFSFISRRPEKWYHTVKENIERAIEDPY